MPPPPREDRRRCLDEAVSIGLWPSVYQRPQMVVERAPPLRAASLWEPEELAATAGAVVLLHPPLPLAGVSNRPGEGASAE